MDITPQGTGAAQETTTKAALAIRAQNRRGKSRCREAVRAFLEQNCGVCVHNQVSSGRAPRGTSPPQLLAHQLHK